MKPLCLLLAASIVTAMALPGARAQQGPTEYELKAAFLFNFARFVEWPAESFSDPGDAIVLGVIGEDPFNGSLDRVNGKSVNGRQVVIKRIGAGQDPRYCHIVFISQSEKKHLSPIMASLNGASVLTVSEINGFVRSGGMINLMMEDNRVRFEINAGAAARARLRISSKLLSLAKTVTN